MTPATTGGGPVLLTADERAAALRDNEGMVWWLARRWGRPHGITGDRLADLAAEVRLGFVEAAHRFDRRKGNRFATYAAWHGRNRATNWLLVELASGLHVPHRLGFRRVRLASLDTPSQLGESDGDNHAFRNGLGATVADHREPEPEARPADWWLVMLAGLPDRERRILELRFRDGLTQQDTADREGISRVRVQQIYDRGIKRLRRQFAGTDVSTL